MPALPPDLLQVRYSVADRDVEHEILPVASRFGISVMAWSPLGGGLLAGPLSTTSTLIRRGYSTTSGDRTVAETLTRLAHKAGSTPAKLAIG